MAASESERPFCALLLSRWISSMKASKPGAGCPTFGASLFLRLMWDIYNYSFSAFFSSSAYFSSSPAILAAASSAASICDCSLPPASAISGLPPPEPPTSFATAPPS
jgi:hypothetical protein